MKLDGDDVTGFEDLDSERIIQFAVLRPLMHWAVLDAVEGRSPMERGTRFSVAPVTGGLVSPAGAERGALLCSG